VARNYTFFEKYFQASTVDEDGHDITDFVRKVSVRWLIGCAARALDPGCKMDTVLVLEGLTGTKKTTAFEVLAGEWYGLMTQQITDKDAQMQSVRRWIVELGELSSLSNTKLEQLKAHLSSPKDSFRPPYADAVEDFPRRCVFVGSTEQERYLHDDLGNRRFWPIKCGGDIDIEALKQDRDQNWAEAVVRFLAKEKWWFDREDNDELERITVQRLDTGTFEESILNWWQKMAPGSRPATVGMVQVAVDALKMPEDRINKQAVGRALKKLGFKRLHVDVGGIRRPMYVPPETLRNAPRSDSTLARLLSMVKTEEAKGLMD
jgi:predicted P-loop ATPase